MAPKTGCTSLTKALGDAGYKHWDNDSWHQMEVPHDYLRARRVIVTYRDPRERLMSIWAHTGGGRSLLDFVIDDVINGCRQFRYKNLGAWYRGLKIHDVIRLNHLREDCNRVLRIPLQFVPHRNATEHPSWQQAFEEEPMIPRLLAKWINEDLAMLSCLTGLA